MTCLSTLNLENKEAHRKFGVAPRGHWSALTREDANDVLDSTMQQMCRYGPFPFPVVLLFFTMENSEGWYTWAAKPVVSPGGGFELIQCGEASCRPLDTGAIDQIVEVVDRWYDAFFRKAIREAPARATNKSSGMLP